MSGSYVWYRTGQWWCPAIEQSFSTQNPRVQGAAGLVHARFTADGRHVLTTAEFNLRITVWSLISQKVNYLKFPKKTGASESKACV